MPVQVPDRGGSQASELISRRATPESLESSGETAMALRFSRVNGVVCSDLGPNADQRRRFLQRNASPIMR
jgi:hypothetical protein